MFLHFGVSCLSRSIICRQHGWSRRLTLLSSVLEDSRTSHFQGWRCWTLMVGSRMYFLSRLRIHFGCSRIWGWDASWLGDNYNHDITHHSAEATRYRIMLRRSFFRLCVCQTRSLELSLEHHVFAMRRFRRPTLDVVSVRTLAEKTRQ